MDYCKRDAQLSPENLACDAKRMFFLDFASSQLCATFYLVEVPNITVQAAVIDYYFFD